MEEEKDQLIKRVERLKKRVNERSKAVAYGCHHPCLARLSGECKQRLRLACRTSGGGRFRWLTGGKRIFPGKPSKTFKDLLPSSPVSAPRRVPYGKEARRESVRHTIAPVYFSAL